MMLNKLLAIGILIPVLILTAPNVYARHLSDTQRYNDGYSNGSDAAATDLRNGNPFNAGCDPNGTFTSGGGHTTTYCNGWTDGYTSTYNGGGGSSPPTVPPSPGRSTQEDFARECNVLQVILVEPCSTLVNPDNTLTQPDGQRAHDCIQNGIALGVGGLLVTNGNLGLVIEALKILSKQIGCDNVVNWNPLGLDQLNLLKSIFG
jgi:hypothetical protein